jgi:hypothetical protein
MQSRWDNQFSLKIWKIPLMQYFSQFMEELSLKEEKQKLLRWEIKN